MSPLFVSKPWGIAPSRDCRAVQAVLQELERGACGGEKRTFRNRQPKERGAADGSEQPRVGGRKPGA